jgi:hypothetical protein
LRASIAKSGIQPPRSIGSYVHFPAEQIEQRGARANIVVPAGHMRPCRPFRALAITPRVSVASIISLMTRHPFGHIAHLSTRPWLPSALLGQRGARYAVRGAGFEVRGQFCESALSALVSPLHAPRSRLTVHGSAVTAQGSGLRARGSRQPVTAALVPRRGLGGRLSASRVSRHGSIVTGRSSRVERRGSRVATLKMRGGRRLSNVPGASAAGLRRTGKHKRVEGPMTITMATSRSRSVHSQSLRRCGPVRPRSVHNLCFTEGTSRPDATRRRADRGLGRLSRESSRIFSMLATSSTPSCVPAPSAAPNSRTRHSNRPSP